MNLSNNWLRSLSIYNYAIIVIMLIGFIIRLVNIGELSLWVDEFVHFNRARFFLHSSSPLLTNDNNGILYTISILPFFKLFSESTFWARFPSVLFGTGSIFLTYQLGKTLTNRYVGLIAAFLNASSLYLIYWSRLARNYSIYEFFFLLFLLVLWHLLEPNIVAKEPSFLHKKNIDKKHIFITIVVFFLAVLSHRLIYLSLFAIPVYLCVLGLITRKNKLEKNRFKYTYLGFVSFFGVLLLVVLFVTGSLEGFLELFLPLPLIEWVLPDFSRLIPFWKSTPFKNYLLYQNVFIYDLKIPIVVLSIIGLILGVFKSFKSTFYIFLFFAIPFLLLCFIFIEPALPKFAIILIPLLHLFFGIFCFGIFKILNVKYLFFKKTAVKMSLALLPFLFIVTQLRFDEVLSLVKVEKKSGFLISRKLSNWSFVNYKDAIDYVKPLITETDVVLATITEPFEIFLDNEIHQFRQHYYNRSEHKYESYSMEMLKEISARSVENLQLTYDLHDRGWLLADYYFDNAMTSLSAKMWVYSHMNMHKNASKDGSVRVFSWDKSVAIPSYQIIADVLGKESGPQASAQYPLIVPSSDSQNITAIITAEDIDANEAYLLLNDTHFINIPKNTKPIVQQMTIEIPKSYLRDKQNFVQFVYKKEVVNDKSKGFIIYNLTIDTN